VGIADALAPVAAEPAGAVEVAAVSWLVVDEELQAVRSRALLRLAASRLVREEVRIRKKK
jgi:hypothetical protein